MTAPTGDEGTRLVRVLCSLSPPATTTLLGPGGGAPHVRLTINDVSLADAPATTVRELDVVLDADTLVAGRFEVSAPLMPGRQFALSAHVDRSGDGTVAVAVGDLITTVRIPVPSDRDDISVDVPLTEVR